MFDALAFAQTSRDAWETIIRSRFSAHVDARSQSELPRVDRLHMLELELQSMRASYQIALQYRNSAIAACRLPSEVLATIFALAQDNWSPRYGLAESKGYYKSDAPLTYFPGWITVTYVCARWRQVALHSPHLWCKLDCIHLDPRRAVEYILLSRGLPLTLKLSEECMPYQAKENTPIVAGNWLSKATLERTECLDIRFTKERFEPWAQCLRLPAPSLRELRIRITQSNAPLMLDRRMFASQCPTPLRLLRLDGCYISWKSPLFSTNLTHLTLASSEYMEIKNHIPTLDQMQDILSRMPNLQELELDGVLPRKGRQEVAVMHLSSPFKRLHVTMYTYDTYDRFEAFWESFTLVHTAVVVVEICIDEFALNYSEDGSDSEEEEEEDISATFTPLFDGAPRPRELALGEEYVSVRYTPLLPLSSWVSSIRSDMKGHGNWREDTLGSRHLFVHAKIPKYTEDWPIEDVHTLLLSSDAMRCFKNMAAWLNGFKHARQVSRIAVPYADSLQLLYALAETQDDAADGSSLALFPELKEIVFVGDRDGEKISALHAPLDVSLLELLGVRRESGMPISRVMVEGALWTWDIWGRIAAGGTQTQYFIWV